MAEQVILRIQPHTGYAPNQVTESITLRGLADAVAVAIDDFGEDAMIVLDDGNRYGATFGLLSPWEDLFVEVDDDEER